MGLSRCHYEMAPALTQVLKGNILFLLLYAACTINERSITLGYPLLHVVARQGPLLFSGVFIAVGSRRQWDESCRNSQTCLWELPISLLKPSSGKELNFWSWHWFPQVSGYHECQIIKHQIKGILLCINVCCQMYNTQFTSIVQAYVIILAPVKLLHM